MTQGGATAGERTAFPRDPVSPLRLNTLFCLPRQNKVRLRGDCRFACYPFMPALRSAQGDAEEDAALQRAIYCPAAMRYRPWRCHGLRYVGIPTRYTARPMPRGERSPCGRPQNDAEGAGIACRLGSRPLHGLCKHRGAEVTEPSAVRSCSCGGSGRGRSGRGSRTGAVCPGALCPGARSGRGPSE